MSSNDESQQWCIEEVVVVVKEKVFVVWNVRVMRKGRQLHWLMMKKMMSAYCVLSKVVDWQEMHQHVAYKLDMLVSAATSHQHSAGDSNACRAADELLHH